MDESKAPSLAGRLASLRLHIPTGLHSLVSALEDAFLINITVRDGISDAELFAKFMGFISQQDGEIVDMKQNMLRCILQTYEEIHLKGESIYATLDRVPISKSEKLQVIGSYYEAVHIVGANIRPQKASLLAHRADEAHHRRVFAVFGGQGLGDSYFSEFRDLFKTYPSLIGNMLRSASKLLHSLLQEANAEDQFSHGIDFLSWLESPDDHPGKDYLTSAPISFPLIGLFQLANYEMVCKTLGIQPGQLRDSLSGVTGHSQGLIIAAAIATSDDWKSWKEAIEYALTSLFWIGLRSHQASVDNSASVAIMKDSEKNGEGVCTPMLSLRGLGRDQVQSLIDKVNRSLRGERRIGISLVNGPQNFVVSGPKISLYGLNRELRRLKKPSLQGEVSWTSRYLPVTAPFHSKSLEKALEQIDHDLERFVLRGNGLKIPLFCTNTGRDLRQEAGDNLVPELTRLVTTKTVDWLQASEFAGATHVLDFGPGSVHGIGALVATNKSGESGPRVILAGTVSGTSTNLGYQPELFQPLVDC